MSSIESFYIIFEIKKLADICWFSSSTDHLLAGSEGGFEHVLRGISALIQGQNYLIKWLKSMREWHFSNFALNQIAVV